MEISLELKIIEKEKTEEERIREVRKMLEAYFKTLILIPLKKELKDEKKRNF